jgi:hypothetical protein
MTLTVGDNVFLPCVINATPQELMVVWQKDDIPLKLGSKKVDF